MRIDPFTYALINNIDPVSGQPLQTGYGPEIYKPNIAQGIPGSGGRSKYLYGARPESNWQYVKAGNQGILDSLFNGIGSNLIAGTVSKVGEGVGMVLNIPNAIAANDVTKLFDNGISNWFANLHEEAKEALPIHIGRQYEEGNFMQKLGTEEFWFNEGFDAVSFLASAYVPGGLVSKLGIAKQIGNLGTRTIGAKAANGLKKLTAEQIESGFTQGFSTVYNTTTEAAFEAKDAYENVFNTLKAQYGEEHAKKKASEAAARVFRANVAGLLIPNAIQSSFFHGSNAANLSKIKDLIRANKSAEEVIKESASIGKEVLKGIASEGLWEENFQGAVQQYETRLANGWSGDMLGEYSYGLMQGLKGTAKLLIPGVKAPAAGTYEDEALTSIALGGLIGGGMGAYSALKDRAQLGEAVTAEQAAWQKIKNANLLGKGLLLDNYTVGLKSFGVTDEVDAEGKPTGKKTTSFVDPATGEVAIDPQKMQDLVLRRTKDMALGAAQLDATLLNNKYMMDLNKEYAMMSYAWHLRSIPGLSKEDVADILKYDLKLPIGNELAGGIGENFLNENIAKIEGYLKLYDSTEENASSGYEFSDSEADQRFGQMLRRAYFYDAAKKTAIENLRRNAPEAVQAQMDQMIESIDAHLRGFKNLIPKFKEIYDTEIEPGIQLQERLKQVNLSLLDKALADDAREELLLERETLAYQLEELIETDNYYPEYFGGMRGAEYASVGMSRNEPAYHTRRRGNQFVPVTKKEGYYFNKAKRALLDKEVNRDLADPNNNIFDTIDKITRDDYSGLPLEDTTVTNLSITLAREKSLFEATATLDDLASIKDSLTELVQVAPESSSENYDEEFQFAAPFIEQAINLLKGEPATPEEMQEIASNPNAFLMLYKDIDASIKAQELTKARFENYESKLRDYNTNRGNILQELADVDAMSPQERNEYFKFEHFKEKTRGISDTINRAKKDPDNFADSVDREIALASQLVNITKARTDISDDLKNKILSKLSEMIMFLQQIKEFADKKRAKRYEQQRLSEIAYGESLKEILTTPGAILDIIIEVIGEATYNEIIKDINNYDQKNNPFEGYEAILALVKKNATKEQLDRLSAKLDEQADNQIDIIFNKLSSQIAVVDTGATGILANIKAGLKKFNTQRGEFITNPGSGARKVLMLTDFFVEKKNAPVQQNTPLNPYQVFNLDLDFTTLYYNLQGKDIPKTERDIIETLWDLNLKSRAYHTIAASTEGTLDAVELYKFESAAIEEDKKFPTVQQALSFREAIKQLLAPKASGAFGISAVFGIFGSGKTAMIAKKALHFLVPKDKRKEKILAFAQSERTSQKIADSVGGTATTFDNFLSMTEAQLAGIDFLVVDEAFVLDSDQVISIKNHAVQNKIKVLFLGDPSQNRAEDIITLRQDITTAQPLTVVLRTNNPAITKFSKEFQYNPTKVESVVAEATSSVSEMNETSSGVFVTEPGQDPMQQIINLAKNPNGKSKLIITNNPQRKVQYENALAGTDVRVVSPKEAQGDEASEVYMDLDRSGQDVNGGAIANEYVFNTMVATSASRAVDKLIVARNSSFVVTPVVQTSLHDAIADLKDEFNKYQEDYTRSLLAYKHFYEKYLGVTLSTPKKEPNQPEPDPKEPDTNPEPPAGPKPPKEEGDVVLQNPEGINADKVRPGQGFVVRAVVSGGRVADERWVVMAPAKDSDGYVVAGVLGAEEIQSETFTPEQQKRATNIGELFRLSTERKVVYSYENFEANIIRSVNVKYAKPLWFNFGEAKKATKVYIQSLMQKFFFEEGVSIEGDVTTNLRIYNQDTEAGEFSPKKGVPYVVISGYNVPQKKGFKFPGNLHIILIPPKLRKDSNHVKDLTAVKGAVDELSAKLGKDPVTFFNSKEFEDMLDDFAKLHSVDTTSIDLPIIQAPGYEDAIGEFQQKHSVPQDAIPALGKLVHMVYGAEKSNLTIKESEFEQWKRDNPNKQDAQWERIEYRSEKKRKEAEEKGEVSDIGYITYLEKTSTGKEYRATVTKTILSLNEGRASKAWSAVAAANADIAGYNPRVLMYKAGSSMKHKILKKHTKSFIGHRSSNRLAYTHIKDIFNQFAKQAEAIANDMGPGHPNYENMKDLYVQLYKWGHSKYGREEYLKVLERIKYLTGETEEYRDNAERPEWMPFFSLGVMDERGERDVTIEEFLEYKSTKPVPYSALQALTEDANYTPEGHSQNYYTNVSLNEGNIEMDGESIAYDSARFDELGFTTTVQSITPAEVVVNYGAQTAQEPQEEIEERSEEELSDIEQQAEQLIADILPYRPGFSRQDIINYVKQKTGKNNPSQEWLDFLAESLERYQRESEFIAEEDDADYFGKNKTIFEDTIPGKLQSLEWARATLKKILPGLDLDRQVEFLDELQMHMYEEEGQEVLGRVFNAIMKLRTIENKGVYDQVVYHEAFHMAWRYLFSEGTKKRLKVAFRAVYGKEMTDYETIEGLAELYQRYEQRQNIKKSWLRKLIEDIRGFFDAIYRHRMYIEDTFFNLDRGKYAAVPKANLKEGSPDNLSFVKTNFGSRQLYLNAVEHIRRRIIAYTREGTKVHFDRTKRATILPMTRDEIFDAIYSELVRDEQNARDDADQFRSVITRLYGVKSISELKEKMRGLEKLLNDMLKDENKDLDLYDTKKKEYTDIVAKFNQYKNLLDKRKMYKTLISMNLKTKNYIFDEVVENIYPSFRTSDRYNFEIDTLSEEEAEAMSEQDKEMLAEMGVDTDTPTSLAEDFNAIRAETVDHAKINWASKQSLALKDFFSFVPLYERDTDKIKKDAKGKDIIINPKIAYVRALQIITQLNLNSPNLAEELAYYRRTNFINSWDYSILWALERLVGDVNQLEDMSGVWSIIPQTYDLTNKVDFHFFYDTEGSSIHDVDGLPIHSHALNYKDVLTLQKKFPNRYILIRATDNSLISLYQQVLEDPYLPNPTPEQFSAIYKGRESVNTLANIQSFMGSLKDTDYRISQKSIKGKSKTLNLITARSSDRHINNRAIIQEAFRDDFEKEEPLIKQHIKIKQILNYLQSEKIDDKAQGINILLKHLGISRDFTVDKKVLTRASSALITLIKTLENSSTFPVIQVSYMDTNGVEQSTDQWDLDSWFVANNAGFGALVNVIGREDPHPRGTTIISVLKQKIYKHTLTNPIYKAIGDVIAFQERTIGNAKESLRKLPEYFEPFKEINPFLKINPANNKPILRLHDIFEIDGHKDKYGAREYGSGFLSMDKKKFNTMQFSSMFLANLGKQEYEQLFYQQADKPRPIGATIDFITDSKLDALVPILLENANYYLDPQREGYFKMHNKAHASGKLVNGALIQTALQNATREDGAISVDTFKANLRELFAKEAVKLAKNLVESKVDIFGNANQLEALNAILGTKGTNTRNANLERLNVELQAQGVNTIDDFTQLPENATKGGQYHATVPQLAPYAYAFMMNYYINGYFMNQLVNTSSQFFGNGKTVIKRMTGAAGPGHVGYIHDKFGIRKKFRTLVVGDDATSSDTIFSQVLKATLRNPLDQFPELKEVENARQLKDTYDSLQAAEIVTIDDIITFQTAIAELRGNNIKTIEDLKESLEVLKKFFGTGGIERTDGQVFITPRRLAELQRGYGREFRLANILKPKYFGPRIEQVQTGINEAGEAIFETLVVPTYIKPSAVVLSDELLYQKELDENGNRIIRPGMQVLARLRAKMENNNIDELAFGSAVKLGKPKDTISWDDLLTSEDSAEITKGILSLNSEHYGIQLNPRAKVDSTTALFTQLLYFLNIYSSSPKLNNIDKANLVYSAVAFLFEKGGKLFQEKLDRPGGLAAELKKSFSERGDELIFADLLEEGISPTSPIFEKKTMIKLASMMERLAIKIRLPGGKLVLQTDAGITNSQTGKPLRFKTTPEGKFVAEVIVPKGMLPEDIEREILKGNNVFDNPILMGFRIPSTELHSAVSMEVVGFYEDGASTNMVVAPELLVALHGSDFDVDSLFIAKRPIAKETIQTSSKEAVETLMDLASDLEGTLALPDIKENPLYNELLEAYEKIRKGVGSESESLTAEEYNDIMTPRVAIEIENDFQEFAKRGRFNLSDPQSNLAARRLFAQKNGLGWLDRLSANQPINPAESAQSSDENVIMNSRKWTILSGATYAIYDMRRILYNLSKNPEAMQAAPAIQKKLNRFVSQLSMESAFPEETFIKEGDIIGFVKDDRGKYILNPHYDKIISRKIEEIKELREKVRKSGYKQIGKLLSKQYNQLLELKEEYYKATIVETFLDTISDPKNAERMTRPISKSYLVEKEGKDKDGNPMYAPGSAMYEVDQRGLVDKHDPDLSNYNDAYDAFKSVADMQRLTGIFANTIKVLSYLNRASTAADKRQGTKQLSLITMYREALSDLRKADDAAKLKKAQTKVDTLRDQVMAILEGEKGSNKAIPALLDEDLQFYFNVGDKSYHITQLNEFVLGTNNKVSIYDILDALVNIAIDNIKDQELFSLQATIETANVYAALVSLGIPASDIINTLYTPIVQQMLNRSRINSKVKLVDTASRAYNELSTQIKDRLIATLAPEDLKALEDNHIKIKEASVDDILEILPKLEKYRNIRKAFGKQDIIDIMTNPKFNPELNFETSESNPTMLPDMKDMSIEDTLKLYNVISFLKTGVKLGDNITTISKLISPLRDMPANYESIEEYEAAINDLGQLMESSIDAESLEDADISDRETFLKKLKNLKSIFYTHQTVGYKMGAFFINNPHIYSAYRRIMQLKKTLQDNFPLLSPDAVEALKENYKKTGLTNPKSQASIREQLRRYLMTQVVDREFHKLKYNVRLASRRKGKVFTKTVYGMEAWAAKFTETVKKVQAAERALALKEGREPNFFLDSLYLDGGQLKFTFDSEPDRIILEDLRKAFSMLKYYTFEGSYKEFAPSYGEVGIVKNSQALQDFDMEYNASEFQKDFLYYVTLYDGMRFSMSNYSAAIPPAMLKKFEKKAIELEKRYATDENFRKAIAFHSKVEILRENAGLIGSYISVEDEEKFGIREAEEAVEKKVDEQGKEISMPKNGVFTDSSGTKVYYDRAYDNPLSVDERAVKELREKINSRFPMFITRGYDNNIEVYMRVTDVMEDKIAYISIGRPSGAYTKVPDINNMQAVDGNYSTNMPTQFVEDVEKETFVTKRKYDYLKPHEPLRLVSYADRSRISPKEVTIVNTEEVYHNYDGQEVPADYADKKYFVGYRYTVRPYIKVEAGSSVIRISTLEELEQAHNNPNVDAVVIDTQTYLELLLDKAPKDSVEWLLGKARQEHLKKSNLNPPVIIKVTEADHKLDSAGTYFPALDTITIQESADTNQYYLYRLRILIHESVHASTNIVSIANAFLGVPPIFVSTKKVERAFEAVNMDPAEVSKKLSNLGYTGPINKQLQDFANTLEDIRTSAIASVKAQGVSVDFTRDHYGLFSIHYGLSSISEMFTEFLSRPVFREDAKLIEIPVEGRVQTLFNFILDTIAKLFAGKSAVYKNKTSLYNLLDSFIESGLFDELRISQSTQAFQERFNDIIDLIETRIVPTSNQKFKEDLQKVLTAEIQGELGNERLTAYGNVTLRTLVDEVVKHDHNEHKTTEKVDRDQVASEQVEVTPDEKAYEHKTTKTTYRRVTDTLNGWLSHFLRNPREKEAIKDRADRVWEGYPEDKILFTDLGKLNKADYIEKSTLIERKGILRGRIIHAYLEAYVNGDPKGDLSRKIGEMLEETGYKGEDFTWLSNNDKVGGILKHILSKADINSLDNISPEKKDIIRSEMHLFNDILGIAGSTDLIIYHADGSVSFKDIKAGYRHFAPNSGETLLYGDQPASSRLVYNDWDHKARLQVMTYAFLYKLANPDAKIKGMDILWMPDAHAISSPNFRTEVNPEVYLNMIRDMLKDKMPDKLQELELDLIKRLGETEGKKAWANIWNPKSYMVGYSKDLREDMGNKNKDVPVDQQLKAAIEDLRLEIMQGLNPHTFQQATYSSQGHAGSARDERIRKKMKNIIELQKQTTQLDFMTTKEDIGRFQDWLFTASTTNNAYIQMWDEFFMSRRDKYNEEVNILRNKFLSLVRPILEEYLRKHPGKGTLSAITRGTINGVNPRELYAFAYIPVDIDGNQIKNSEEPVAEYILRHKEEHFQDLVNDNVNFPYINSTNIHLYKNLLTFVNETYAGFFKDTETKKALANRPATYTFGKGGIKVPITNLQLHNGKRSTFDKEGSRKSDLLFEYKDGFFFKVPPMLEEFGFMNSRWRKIWFQRNLTFTEEHQFEGFDKKAIAEGLPMKYLGSGMRELRNNPELFSMHLEHQFDRATRAYLWKENMDDVFAYGQGIRIMLNVENARGEGENVPERLIQFMKRELDLKLRGRPSGYDKNEDYISKNKYNVNIVKILAKIKYWLNFPLLAGNYVGGSANAAFTTLMTLKQAAQNDVIKRLERGAALPGLNGDEWDFGMKELAASMPDVTAVYVEGMKGDIRNSKVYQLAKRFGYLPNNFDWSTAPNNLITSANRGLSTDILFTFYSLPEEFIAMLVMTAQLKSMKITSGSMAGKSLYDMYEFYDAKDENGNIYKELRWATDPTTGKPYVRAVVNTSADPDNPSYTELTSLDGKEVRRLYSAYDRMHGGYRNIDKISLDYTILGQLALQFKRYLPHILRQALASNAYRSNLGYYKVTGALEDGTPTVEWVSKVMEGRWRVLGGSILEGLKVILQTDNIPKDPQSMYDKFRASLAGMSSYKWNELNAGQKEALVDAYTTLLLLGTGAISLLALGGDADDDDPAYRYIARIFNDLTQMYNPLELTKNLVNWSPVSLKKLYDTQRDASTVLLSSLLWLSGSNERAFTREGRLEGFNALMRDIPLGAVYRKTEDFATSDMLFGE